MEKVLKQIENIFLFAIIFLVPLIVLPIFPAIYITPKLLILTWGLAAILLLKAIRVLIKGHISFSSSSFDLPVLIFGLAFVLGMFSHSQSLIDAVLVPGLATTILGGVVLYFVINQLGDKKGMVKYPLLLSGVFIAIFELFAVSGITRSFNGSLSFMQANTFTLLEATLPTFVFLVVLLALTLPSAIREKEIANKTLFGVISAVLVLGVIIAAYFALPGKTTTPQYPNLTTSWAVTADSIKENPIFGTGPGNYSVAFSRFRPLTSNAGTDWMLRYNSGGSFFMTILTETGVLGLIAIIFLVLKYFFLVRSKSFTPAVIALGILGALLLIMPATTGVVMLLFVMLALAGKTKENKLELVTEEGSKGIAKLPVYLVTIPVLIFVPLFLFFSGKLTLGEFVYRQALNSIIANDGQKSYQQLQQAITLNPYLDRYRITYAQINLALANSIAGSVKEGEQLTEEQQNTISQLVQQAIQQGKAAVTLSPLKASNWEVLSGVYKSIIPLAKGSDQFALQTMQQAINLDPLNPNYRIALGGIFYQLKDYDSAIDAFKFAVATKPDLPNAHYNLAVAYREKGDIEKAIAEINNVLALVTKDSEDYKLAQKELESLESKRPAQPQTGEGETLDGPEQAPETTPSATLPPDAAPPVPSTTQTPESDQTPTPDTP